MDKTVEEAAKMMLDHNFSVLPVTNEDGDLVGILTESDFVGKDADIPHAMACVKSLFGQTYAFGNVEDLYKKAKTKKVSEVMTHDPTCVESKDTLSKVVAVMSNQNLKRLPVVDGNKVVGIITRKDIIKAFSKLD